MKEINFEAVLGELEEKKVSRDNHWQNIWDWLCFSCEITDCGESLISVFEDVFASIKKILILAGNLGPTLWFYEVCTLSSYLLIFFLIFPNFVRQLPRQLVYTMFLSYNLTSLDLLWTESLVKHQKSQIMMKKIMFKSLLCFWCLY